MTKLMEKLHLQEDQRLGVLEIEARYNDSSLKRPFATPVPSVYNVDVYNMGVFKYESVYIGLPAMFHSVAPDSGNTDGFHLIKAVTSRDLQSWSWLGNRSTFITPSKVDSGAACHACLLWTTAEEIPLCQPRMDSSKGYLFEPPMDSRGSKN